MTVFAVVPIVSVEVAVVEVHVVRVVTIFVRSRPVVAVGTDIVDRSPVTPARSGQEDSSTLQQPSFTKCQKNLSEPMTLLTLSLCEGAIAYELFLVSFVYTLFILMMLSVVSIQL